MPNCHTSHTNIKSQSFSPKAGNNLVGSLILFFLLSLIGIFIWGFIQNNTEIAQKQEAQQALQELKKKQTSEAQEYTKKVIEDLEADGSIIDIETRIGRCAYDDVVDQLAVKEKKLWTIATTKQKLTTAFEGCKAKEESKNGTTVKANRQTTAHLVCQRYAKNYFFPYEVKFHNIAGIIYDKARGNDEWVYTLDITVSSSQGGAVRYNMDCVAGHFSSDNSNAEVVMFEALPY